MGLAMHGATPPTDEDCLTLNLWRPRGVEERLPALVWIHGGGWTLGFSSQGATHGSALASATPCVVITINYRLGSLGWLHHPDLAGTPGEPIGNWGLLDHIAALRWLNENANAFGIDSTRITVAGHSAGALAVLNLLVTPASKGLFQRAIVQSGPLLDAAIDPDQATSWATQISEALGSSGFSAGTVRAASVDTILEVHERLHHQQPSGKGRHGGAVPCLDPVTLPDRIVEVPAVSPGVSVLIGHGAQEGTFRMLADPTLRLDVDAINAATESRFALPISRWAAERATGGCRVHRYRVDQPALDPQLGATHGVEIPLIFGTYATDPTAHSLVGDGPNVATVSRAMMRAWGDFIRTGDPGWRPLGSGGGDQLGVFGGPDGVTVEATKESNERKK
jgi:para-nitrobenzyl esterase